MPRPLPTGQPNITLAETMAGVVDAADASFQKYAGRRAVKYLNLAGQSLYTVYVFRGC